MHAVIHSETGRFYAGCSYVCECVVWKKSICGAALFENCQQAHDDAVLMAGIDPHDIEIINLNNMAQYRRSFTDNVTYAIINFTEATVTLLTLGYYCPSWTVKYLRGPQRIKL